jgi:predicted transglutaminase-like cysteine proteinase
MPCPEQQQGARHGMATPANAPDLRAVFLAASTRGGAIVRWVGTFVLAATISAAGAGARAAEDDAQVAMPRYFTINEVVATLDVRAANPEPSPRSIKRATFAAPPPATMESREPFGLVTFRAPEGLLWAKWRKLEAELGDDAQMLAYCRADRAHCSNPAALKYLTLIDHARGLQGRARIAWINRTINAVVRYASDPDQYGVDDLWSPPLVTLQTGLGDCEDYAIAKYVLLRDAGYEADNVRFVIVRDRLARQDHAVAAVREGGRWLMLDNRHDVLLEHKDTGHFIPMFALDLNGVKLFAVPYGSPPVSAPAQVSSGPANATSPPGATVDWSPEVLGLRLDTFDPPQLRGGL